MNERWLSEDVDNVKSVSVSHQSHRVPPVRPAPGAEQALRQGGGSALGAAAPGLSILPDELYRLRVREEKLHGFRENKYHISIMPLILACF